MPNVGKKYRFKISATIGQPLFLTIWPKKILANTWCYWYWYKSIPSLWNCFAMYINEGKKNQWRNSQRSAFSLATASCIFFLPTTTGWAQVHESWSDKNASKVKNICCICKIYLFNIMLIRTNIMSSKNKMWCINIQKWFCTFCVKCYMLHTICKIYFKCIYIYIYIYIYISWTNDKTCGCLILSTNLNYAVFFPRVQKKDQGSYMFLTASINLDEAGNWANRFYRRVQDPFILNLIALRLHNSCLVRLSAGSVNCLLKLEI